MVGCAPPGRGGLSEIPERADSELINNPLRGKREKRGNSPHGAACLCELGSLRPPPAPEGVGSPGQGTLWLGEQAWVTYLDYGVATKFSNFAVHEIGNFTRINF